MIPGDFVGRLATIAGISLYVNQTARLSNEARVRNRTPAVDYDGRSGRWGSKSAVVDGFEARG